MTQQKWKEILRDFKCHESCHELFPCVQEFHLTALSNCLDGDASTYFLVQPQETPTSITVDLGAEYKACHSTSILFAWKVMSFEIRFARINNEDYFASVAPETPLPSYFL